MFEREGYVTVVVDTDYRIAYSATFRVSVILRAIYTVDGGAMLGEVPGGDVHVNHVVFSSGIVTSAVISISLIYVGIGCFRAYIHVIVSMAVYSKWIGKQSVSTFRLQLQ